MSLNIAIRFNLPSIGDVDFYQAEVDKHKIAYMRDHDLQVNQSIPSMLLNRGDLWRLLEIDFIEYWSTTRAKIEQLINEQLEMTVYYAFAYYGATQSFNCIYLPKNRSRLWGFGERQALVKHTLSFLEV